MKPGAYIEVGPGPSVVDRPIEVCPTCKAGRLEKGVASMPNECCAIYFCGQGSEMHMQWKWQIMSPAERARRTAARDRLAAERMAAEEDRDDRHAKIHAFLVELRGMASSEILEMAKRSGIYDEDGNLTPEYGGEPVPCTSGGEE